MQRIGSKHQVLKRVQAGAPRVGRDLMGVRGSQDRCYGRGGTLGLEGKAGFR